MSGNGFGFTGSAVSFVVPAGVTSITAELWGAQGAGAGGQGAHLKVTFAVTPGETLQVNVGGQPLTSEGGFNGGGRSLAPNLPGGGGGGASDIRRGGTMLANRVAVAGGGGGQGASFAGGSGGGDTANAGGGVFCGQGGSQVAGGASGTGDSTAGVLGQGGIGGIEGAQGGGGGGGYYGGGGGTAGCGGGGGSSFSTGTILANDYFAQLGNGAVTLTYNVPPNAPLLSAPANGAVVDVGSDLVFGFTFSDPDGDTQSAFSLRYRIGAGAWTTISGSTATTVLVPAFTLTGGQPYEWQVQTADAAGAVGPWSASFFFTTDTPPAAPVITSPTNGSTVTEPNAPITWTAAAQDSYEIRTVADIAGAPDPTTVYYDSGVPGFLTSALRFALGVFDVNGRTEHVQVRVQAGGLWSDWADVLVTVAWLPPNPPLVLATANNDDGSITVVITNPINLLPAADASLEDGVGSWVANANCAVTQSSTHFLDGAHSLRLRSTAGGDMSAKHGAVVVDPLTRYTGVVRFRAGATPRSCSATIQWLDASNSPISISPGAAVTDGAGGWTMCFASAPSPASAHSAYVIPQAAATGAGSEDHFIDEIDLHVGTSTDFLPGGTPEVSSVDLYRRVASDDGTGIPIARGLTPGDVYNDYRVDSGQLYQYQAVAFAADGTSAASDWSPA